MKWIKKKSGGLLKTDWFVPSGVFCLRDVYRADVIVHYRLLGGSWIIDDFFVIDCRFPYFIRLGFELIQAVSLSRPVGLGSRDWNDWSEAVSETRFTENRSLIISNFIRFCNLKNKRPKASFFACMYVW